MKTDFYSGTLDFASRSKSNFVLRTRAILVPLVVFSLFGILRNASAGEATGLWVGQVELTRVNEVGNPTDTSTPTEVTHPFDIRILLHSEDTDLDDDTNAETVRLLKRVTVMGKRYEVENADGTVEERIRRVLVTDDALLESYEGVSRRDGKMVGLRIGSAAFQFDEDSGADEPNTLDLTGKIGLGETLTGTVALGSDHAVNPFKHKFHPDHRSGFAVERSLTMTFDSETDPDDPDSGVDAYTGDYEETIEGIHKIPIIVKGRFSINRVSLVPTLNDN